MADQEQKQPQKPGSQKDGLQEAAPQKPAEEPLDRVYDSRLIRRLGHYLRPYWWQAAVSALAVSLKSICDVTGPYLIMVAIDRYFPKDSGFSPATNLLANVLSSTNWLTRRSEEH